MRATTEATITTSQRAREGSTTDQDAVAQVVLHHQGMVRELAHLTAQLEEDHEGGHVVREKLMDWFRSVLVPHADEEEVTTYRAAAQLAEGRLLIRAMKREHTLLKRLVGLFRDSDPTRSPAYARAVLEAFTSHQAKENDIILPLLVASPDVQLGDLLGGSEGHQVGGHAHHH